MIINLFATLFLSCLTASLASPQIQPFDFYDTHGRCWRCLPGSSCIKCPANIIPLQNFPTNWDRSCPVPGFGVECAQFPGAKFPSLNINFYWICADGQVALAQCFCEMGFDMLLQECVKSENITSIGCTPYDHSEIMTCDLGGNPGVIPTAPPSTTPSVPTAPTDNPTTLPPSDIPTAPTELPPNDVPTAPTEVPTTLPPTEPPITQPPITTEVGGPDGIPPINTDTTTVSTDADTTPAPCVCIIWWPCWCNPCWNMPCHSCNGCV